eukprot:3383358-Pleurochrysis_carterae.AAC.1
MLFARLVVLIAAGSAAGSPFLITITPNQQCSLIESQLAQSMSAVWYDSDSDSPIEQCSECENAEDEASSGDDDCLFAFSRLPAVKNEDLGSKAVGKSHESHPSGPAPSRMCKTTGVKDNRGGYDRSQPNVKVRQTHAFYANAHWEAVSNFSIGRPCTEACAFN